MRIRNVQFFIKKMDSKNLKNGPKNKDEVINEQIAEYYFAETKKVA